ncbi:MAG: hypothetical protein A3A86_04660 [Elusimicrobia bacterium RIFCSPLOWO2_01_FULL_60_11]|nr:MAG: hypothetical protein A3A86_04660 [Elusimicrobia bacterium RIFCSPLOWO2_01_FULL_60_11]
MANTNELKNVIEPALSERFWKTKNAQQVVPSLGLRRELFGMEFDGIGINREQKTLYFCEITVSGFLGHRGKDFHIGATRKFADAFARFSIITHSLTKASLLRAAERDYDIKLEHIRCHLVVPKGSRFIRALGYRTRLLEMGVMDLTEIELPDNEGEILNRVLKAASAEMS